MNKITLLVCFVCLNAIPNAGWCYGIDTHQDLTEAAAKASVLGKSDVLARIGIRGPIDISPTDVAKQFPDSKGTPRTVLRLIRNGAKFEDEPATNVRNHFYNPVNGAPLSVGVLPVGCTSPDWALEDSPLYPSGQIDNIPCGNQKFSYADARQYFYNALTKFTEPDRDKNLGVIPSP